MNFLPVFHCTEAPGCVLTCWTPVLVPVCEVDEVLFVELTLRAIAGGKRLGNERRDTKLFAGEYFGAVEVAPICKNRQVLLTRRFLGTLSHRCQLGSIIAFVRHLVGNDQVMGRVDCGLDVVANHPGSPAAGGHGAGVRIRQGYLPVGRVVKLLA